MEKNLNKHYCPIGKNPCEDCKPCEYLIPFHDGSGFTCQCAVPDPMNMEGRINGMTLKGYRPLFEQHKYLLGKMDKYYQELGADVKISDCPIGMKVARTCYDCAYYNKDLEGCNYDSADNAIELVDNLISRIGKLGDIDTTNTEETIEAKGNGLVGKDGTGKDDRADDKLRWDLLPLEEIEDIVRVYHAGAKKYADNSWQDIPDGFRRYYAAAQRHLMAYMKGERIDPDTGCFHLAQYAWNAIAMLYYDKHNKGCFPFEDENESNPK